MRLLIYELNNSFYIQIRFWFDQWTYDSNLYIFRSHTLKKLPSTSEFNDSFYIQNWYWVDLWQCDSDRCIIQTVTIKKLSSISEREYSYYNQADFELIDEKWFKSLYYSISYSQKAIADFECDYSSYIRKAFDLINENSIKIVELFNVILSNAVIYFRIPLSILYSKLMLFWSMKMRFKFLYYSISYSQKATVYFWTQFLILYPNQISS
jgi:hypothetical protein